MKRFTSEELVLKFGAVADEKDPDPDPDTQPTCRPCIKPYTCGGNLPPKPPKPKDSERELSALQRQMAGILGS